MEDAECEFVWLEEWTQPSGFEYHASGTVYNTHFHETAGGDGRGVDDYTDERCKVYFKCKIHHFQYKFLI